MHSKRILLITQMYPSGSTGTSVKTLHTMRFLVKHGYTIDVCCPHYHKMIKIPLTIPRVRIFTFERQTISKLSFSYFFRAWKLLFFWKPFRVIKLYDGSLKNKISSLCHRHQYTQIFFDGFSTLQYAIAYDEKYIYIDDEDITDLMWRRWHDTPQHVLRIFYFIEWIKCLLYERVFIPRMSEIWAISPNSKLRLSRLTDKKVLLMPTIVPKQRNIFRTSSKHIVFSGLLSWQENVVGLRWFLRHCWPAIHDAAPQTKLYITGQMAQESLIKYVNSFPNTALLGFVPDLARIYQNCAIAIAPIFTNAGIKVKILTYLSFGLPVIANKEATWGMPSSDGIYISEKNQFTQNILGMLHNEPLRKRLSRDAQKNVQLHHSEKTLKSYFVKANILYET